ncbi:hypothetical protein LXA47_07645 [Massilia sp. P8910]|uniref:hypothetical protein n=1 Tax=Massilia antarctica TaxID=2765360 RepID=UPI001E29E7F4|nr:hypothetical protein [Massilia antarctica]MCE3603478.1 hypothetical protein [Massilia antarctica]
MQMVSANLLAHYRRYEAELTARTAAGRQAAEDGRDIPADLGAAQAGVIPAI